MAKPRLIKAPYMVKSPPIESVLKRAFRNSEGDIDSDSIDKSLWDAAPFIEYLKIQGYRYRECEKYSPITLTYVNGSARWHNDPGFGLVACWLLFENDSGFDGAQLITRHGATDMRVGDVCVFDANQGHAWLCNGIAVMVMITVSQSKQKKALLGPLGGGDQ